MAFIKDRLPDPLSYYESQVLRLSPRGKPWRSAECQFHGGSDSMRINIESGAFVCMAQCGARGGDILSYQMAAHGQTFIEAAKALGAWVGDGRPSRHRPMPFPARDGLTVLREESMLVAVAACNVAGGIELAGSELDRLLQAANRIHFIAEACA
ncbi:hypothetical protein JI739_09175 [Ramlibacter sp. AW1]|uniref:Zinc finger CHC2-type domain-containing protein n=1 Tax=Ramlibacter aurantiacus TaxID=2801330 RepID=A0A936ZMP9_9BURK|nr:hypothetical protein [Ramlibacter aurantiacus]MBL0420511.1 hypothetical protein [Ramlibacter aurantiacus]